MATIGMAMITDGEVKNNKYTGVEEAKSPAAPIAQAQQTSS
jgi:hypothetical protein